VNFEAFGPLALFSLHYHDRIVSASVAHSPYRLIDSANPLPIYTMAFSLASESLGGNLYGVYSLDNVDGNSSGISWGGE